MTAPDGLEGVIGLRVPGSLHYRHLAIRFVTTACKIAVGSDGDGVAPDFEPEVVSAFGEAFNNVAVHGFRGATPEPVQIEVDWDVEKLVITMIDSGRTFDPASVAPPDLAALPEGGMGLFIMTSCMDVIDYQPGPPNVLRMVKLRQQRDGLLPPAPDEGEGRGPASWTIREGSARGGANGARAFHLEDPPGHAAVYPDGGLNGYPDGGLNGYPDGGLNGYPDGGLGGDLHGGLDADPSAGDRGSGIEVIDAAPSATGRGGRDAFRRRAVGSDEAIREVSRRK